MGEQECEFSCFGANPTLLLLHQEGLGKVFHTQRVLGVMGREKRVWAGPPEATDRSCCSFRRNRLWASCVLTGSPHHFFSRGFLAWLLQREGRLLGWQPQRCPSHTLHVGSFAIREGTDAEAGWAVATAVLLAAPWAGWERPSGGELWEALRHQPRRMWATRTKGKSRAHSVPDLGLVSDEGKIAYLV